MITNVESALSKACELTGASVADFTGAPCFYEGK
jgi:hypothetical protein